MPTLNINIPDSDETTKGIAEVATQVEVNTGMDDATIVTPLKLENSDLRSEVTANTAKVGITPTQASDITANNAKVTNATHTGQVTGSGALTVDKTAITDQTAGTVASGDLVLVSDIDDSNNLKKVTAQSIADLSGGGGGSAYSLLWVWDSWNPADATTYWMPTGSAVVPATSSNGNRRNQIPATASNFTLNVGLASNGSTEGVTWYIRNHTQGTEQAFSPTHSWTASGQANAWYGTATLSCTAGDFIEIKLLTPTWATNPTATKGTVLLNFQAD